MGKNPRLAQAKSRNDKNISGLLNQIEDNAKDRENQGSIRITNASAYTIEQTRMKIISIQFASSEENAYAVFCTDHCGCSCGSCGAVCGSCGNCGGSVSGRERIWWKQFRDRRMEAEKKQGMELEQPGMQADQGVLPEVSVDVSLPVKWQEDGQAVCHVVFEFNDEEIVEHCPVGVVAFREAYPVAVLSY